MNRNKIWSFDIPLLTKRIRFTLGLKRREKRIPEFEQLGQAMDELKKAIMESAAEIPIAIIKELKAVGKRGSRAGKKLYRIMKK